MIELMYMVEKQKTLITINDCSLREQRAEQTGTGNGGRHRHAARGT